MRGVFVYDKDCEYLGSFETEKGLCDPELIELYDMNGERYWYYLGIVGSEVHTSSGFASRMDRASINRIISKDGSFSTERLMQHDIIWDDDNSTKNLYVYYVGDREVSESEFKKVNIYYKSECMGSHNFDITDPDDWRYSHMFEDSVITGINKGESN